MAAPTPGKTPDAVTNHRVAGFVQKGPYLNGTAMDISEMDENLVPTGKTFMTRLLDNRGSFEIKGLTVASPFVQTAGRWILLQRGNQRKIFRSAYPLCAGRPYPAEYSRR